MTLRNCGMTKVIWLIYQTEDKQMEDVGMHADKHKHMRYIFIFEPLHSSQAQVQIAFSVHPLPAKEICGK
jgi:hypothetical protein